MYKLGGSRLVNIYYRVKGLYHEFVDFSLIFLNKINPANIMVIKFAIIIGDLFIIIPYISQQNTPVTNNIYIFSEMALVSWVL